MALPYQRPGLSMSRQTENDPALVRALQRDLRALGYLRSGIDGNYGGGTVQAIRALQYDLLHNRGASRADDGRAPVAITDFNAIPPGADQPAVTAVTGVLDQATAECIRQLLDDDRIATVPDAMNSAAENQKAVAAIAAAQSTVAPTPFISAIVLQESNGQHFRVPTPRDEDNFVVVGLDHGNSAAPDAITSRGYGIGQYTLFHHPPRPEEVKDFILDPVRNVQRAYAGLRNKFDQFIVGPTSRADDRSAEHPLLPLRVCRYPPSDRRYMRDCRNCAAAVGKVTITPGQLAYPGAPFGYAPDQYYPTALYHGVPNRAEFLCDWPYAVRRYNGSGNDSFHYQTRILLNLLSLDPPARS